MADARSERIIAALAELRKGLQGLDTVMSRVHHEYVDLEERFEAAGVQYDDMQVDAIEDRRQIKSRIKSLGQLLGSEGKDDSGLETLLEPYGELSSYSILDHWALTVL